MRGEFILEIADHKNGNVVASDQGTAYYLSQVMQDILENLPHGCGITINNV